MVVEDATIRPGSPSPVIEIIEEYGRGVLKNGDRYVFALITVMRANEVSELAQHSLSNFRLPIWEIGKFGPVGMLTLDGKTRPIESPIRFVGECQTSVQSRVLHLPPGKPMGCSFRLFFPSSSRSHRRPLPAPGSYASALQSGTIPRL